MRMQTGVPAMLEGFGKCLENLVFLSFGQRSSHAFLPQNLISGRLLHTSCFIARLITRQEQETTPRRRLARGRSLMG